MKPHQMGALALAALALLQSGAAYADPVAFQGPVTLSTGVVTQGSVPVSSSTPLPVTASAPADTRTTSSDITAADAATSSSSGQNSVSLVTGTPTAASSITWAVNGQSSIVLTVTGTFSATAQIEASADGGTTYVTKTAKQMGTGATSSVVTGKGMFRVDITGVTNVRLRATAYTSGTLSAYATNSPAPGVSEIFNPVPLRGVDGLTAAGAGNGAPVSLMAATTGGCTPGGYQSAASTNATNIKASAGTFCGGMVINTTATIYYLRVYDLAAAPTCSSATGFITSIPIPASTSGNGTLVLAGTFGWAFANGIGFCLTGGGTSTDNTNAATGVFVSYAYK